MDLRLALILLALTPVAAVGGGESDTPEDAVRALHTAYLQKSADAAVAALDFLEGGRQLLQETNPALADDPETIRQTAEVLEKSFRNDLRTKGFPSSVNQKCSFAARAQLAPGLIKLTERCEVAGGGNSVQDLIVMHREHDWRVVYESGVF